MHDRILFSQLVSPEEPEDRSQKKKMQLFRLLTPDSCLLKKNTLPAKCISYFPLKGCGKKDKWKVL
ncbi:MAG: hypothetical protein BM485_06230 [Desulfobulbaceae bacterium DB1]|nr:MAG: hypothetical protein BM485_06230 [Desulfobulbaceae bacterium DB1]